MATRTVILYARKLMKRKKFSEAISILEQNEKKYIGAFDYYLSLGTCYLYVGAFGKASEYYNEARKIRVQHVELYLGQAIVFLSNGEAERALEYYLNVLSLDKDNKTAQKGLEFIRFANRQAEAKMEFIHNAFAMNKVRKFYPPVGVDTSYIWKGVGVGLVLGVFLSVGIVIGNMASKKRQDPLSQSLAELKLTESEKIQPSVNDAGFSSINVPVMSESEILYNLDGADIKKSYETALLYVEKRRDNAARMEINRILNSNAVPSIKAKARDLLSSLQEQTFDSLKDNFSYRTVEKDHALFDGCYVIWDGRIANMQVDESRGSMTLDLLEGYADKKVLEGIVKVYFEHNPVPPIETDKPIRILGTVSDVDGVLLINEVSYYQPLRDILPPVSDNVVSRGQ